MFEKVVLSEYHINDIENCLVLFPVRPIRFSNLPGFDQPFLPVEMGDFLQKALSKASKTSDNTKQDFALFSFLAIMTLGCVHVRVIIALMGEWNPPGYVIHTRRKTFQSDKREAHAKAC